MDDKIYITMFYNFSIKYHDHMLDSDTMKSDKLVKLFAYLLANHQRTVSSSDLVDLLWYFDEVDNPIGALKNLVYRLRALIKKEFQITDLIVTGKGSYSINQDYELIIDTVEFDKLNNLISSTNENLLDNYRLLFKKYVGKYLPEIKDDHNIISKGAYYHSVYIGRMIEYAELLEEEGKYNEMEDVIRKAISIDNLEEKFYEVLIRALYFQKEYKKANETYRTTTDLLYKTLGINPSESLIELHEMIKKEIHDEDSNIFDVQQGLQDDQEGGAFLCEYGTFREIYLMQARMIGRLGICSHLCLVTLSQQIRQEKNEKNMEKIMQKIQTCLVDGLRIGDVVARLSVNQFVVLLPTCNYENSIFVMDRVLRKIRYSLNHTNLTIDYTSEEVLPKE